MDMFMVYGTTNLPNNIFSLTPDMWIALAVRMGRSDFLLLWARLHHLPSLSLHSFPLLLFSLFSFFF